MSANKLFWIVVFLIAAVLLLGGVLAKHGGIIVNPLPLSIPFTPVSVISSVISEDANKGTMSYQAVVIRVVDADTVDMIISVPIPWGKMGMSLIVSERTRICCIDAPESSRAHAKCEEEVQLGKQAKEYLTEVLRPTTKVLLSDVRNDDKYGRILAKIADVSGQDIGEMMISKGLARAYHGGAKSSWCGSQEGDSNGSETNLAK